MTIAPSYPSSTFRRINSHLWILLSLLFIAASIPPDNKTAPIKAIVFDFGNVVATHDSTPLNTFMMTTLGLTKGEYKKVRKRWMKAYKKGVSERQFWEEYGKAHGIAIDDAWLENMHKAMAETMLPVPGTIDIIKKLKERGYTVALLSNVTTGHAYIRRQTGYYDPFNPVLISCEIGIEKPDPKAYQILIETLKIPPNEIIFIDDKLENIRAAEKEGIQGIQFKNAQQLEEKLQEKGVDITATAPPAEK